MADQPLPRLRTVGFSVGKTFARRAGFCSGNPVGILATELQEERVAWAGCSWSRAALFCLGLGTVLLSVFLVVLYWDSDRLAVLGLLSGLFLGLAWSTPSCSPSSRAARSAVGRNRGGFSPRIGIAWSKDS